MPLPKQHFSKSNLPDESDPRWTFHQKRVPTRMLRVEGPFSVDTGSGIAAYLDGGWVAVDSRGIPYPIAPEEYELSYEPVIMLERYGPGRDEIIEVIRDVLTKTSGESIMTKSAAVFKAPVPAIGIGGLTPCRNPSRECWPGLHRGLSR